jgi:hypothetical protein
MNLRRYWFTFEWKDQDERPLGALLGIGVTASDRADAESLLRERVFRKSELPLISSTIEDVDISRLDQDHVIPNMGNVLVRGVWFPQGYE